MTADLIEKTYWACADLLSLGTQIRTTAELPRPEDLQRRIDDMFSRMSQKCRELGILEEDANEARYAICAFLDEQVLSSPWAGRMYWVNQPLQLLYFNENTAGEGFFIRLDALRRLRTRANVVAIYYACLQLGFLGKYAIAQGNELQQLSEQLALELGQQLPTAEVLSPNAEAKDMGRRLTPSEVPIVYLGVGILAAALLIVLLLKVTMMVSVSSLTSKLGSSAVTTPAKAGP
jgi:type VI secretion system protein ImpK